MNKLKKFINKKSVIISLSSLVALSVLLVSYQANRFFPVLENTSSLVSGPVSYNESDVKGISDLEEEEPNEDEENGDIKDVNTSTDTNTAQSNNTDSNQTNTNTGANNQQCTPTLQAKFIRPYEQEYHYHLGDRMNQIIGSYDATCISESDVTYEWFIWGTSNSMPVTKISSASKPDVSGYEDGTYGIRFKVHAKGLSSQLETWGWIQNIVHVPTPIPPYASIIVPIWGLIETRVLSDGGNYEKFYFNRLNVSTTAPTVKWYIQSAHVPRTFIGNGKVLDGAIADLPYASSCQDSTFTIVVTVTSSEGLVTEDSETATKTSNPCITN